MAHTPFRRFESRDYANKDLFRHTASDWELTALLVLFAFCTATLAWAEIEIHFGF